MSESLRIVFAGTPEFAAEHLKALLDTPHQIIAVYSQPDRPAGRGQKLTPARSSSSLCSTIFRCTSRRPCATPQPKPS